MRRFVVLITAMLLSFSGIAFAGLDSVEHVTIGNLIKAVGGNNSIRLAGIDSEGNVYEYENGLDTKEEIKWSFEQNPEMTTSLLPFYYFQKFNDEVWADMKYREAHENDDLSMVMKTHVGRVIGTGHEHIRVKDATEADMKLAECDRENYVMSRSISFLPVVKGVNKPVPAKKIPAAKNGLLNPNKPILLTAYTNKIIMNFNNNVVGESSARLIDSKGKVIGSIGSTDTAEITLPKDKGTYYLEYQEKYFDHTEYWYILLNIEVDPVQPAENKAFTNQLNEMRATTENALRVRDDYMKEKGISDADDLTDEDSQAIVDKYIEQQGGAVMSSQQIIDNYMKEHNITSMVQLTEKDMAVIEKQIIKNSILSLPAAQRSVVDSYMKKNKIKSYDDITGKDMDKIGKLIEKQLSETKKSSGKTKTKSRKSK